MMRKGFNKGSYQQNYNLYDQHSTQNGDFITLFTYAFPEIYLIKDTVYGFISDTEIRKNAA
jgi:hypothetical protein